MPLLVADCPRCGAAAHTFDVTAHVYRGRKYSHDNQHELFSVCRNCSKPTIFYVKMRTELPQAMSAVGMGINDNPDAIMKVVNSLNSMFTVEHYVSLRDNVSTKPPEHLPEEINAAFTEGAACYSIGCYNAAACMFRLCLDLASRPLLPDLSNATVEQPNGRQRRDLGLRFPWLFDRGLLPEVLRELAKCVREDGNDGAHAGTLSKEDASDLMDFTVAFLERLITEPKKLELAEARRKERRK
jgi:hypothetical protein